MRTGRFGIAGPNTDTYDLRMRIDPNIWPEAMMSPIRRLLVAMIVSPILITAALTAVAFVVAGSSESNKAATFAVTEDAAVWFFGTLLGYTLTVGTVGILILSLLKQRSILSWAICGAAAGAATGAVLSFLGTGVIDPFQAGITTAGSLILFLLIRALAGIGNGPEGNGEDRKERRAASRADSNADQDAAHDAAHGHDPAETAS
ncbi:MAG: hypothetical protein AAGG06_00715 [Pseudomonadota bacterium]